MSKEVLIPASDSSFLDLVRLYATQNRLLHVFHKDFQEFWWIDPSVLLNHNRVRVIHRQPLKKPQDDPSLDQLDLQFGSLSISYQSPGAKAPVTFRAPHGSFLHRSLILD